MLWPVVWFVPDGGEALAGGADRVAAVLDGWEQGACPAGHPVLVPAPAAVTSGCVTAVDADEALRYRKPCRCALATVVVAASVRPEVFVPATAVARRSGAGEAGPLGPIGMERRRPPVTQAL